MSKCIIILIIRVGISDLKTNELSSFQEVQVCKERTQLDKSVHFPPL